MLFLTWAVVRLPLVSSLAIRPLGAAQIGLVTDWARDEGFCPGQGDVAIYRQTDRQGLWLGWLDGEPIGCIAGVRYSAAYGFVGLFIVQPAHRGRGHGVSLWRHALAHLADVSCIGLEAAPERISDYAGWGFRAASPTTRWRRHSLPGEWQQPPSAGDGLRLLEAAALPEEAIQAYDAAREPSPRPHFLKNWLHHPAGVVQVLVDERGRCHGFGRIRPCLLSQGEMASGWRIGPLLADTPALAERLLRALLNRHPGEVLIDAPGANRHAATLLRHLDFSPGPRTLRMYRGTQPRQTLADVYGLACLELG